MLRALAAMALLALSTGATAASALTADDAATFFDGWLAPAMQAGKIPGAVAVVVKDGEVLFAKGYGYADAGRLAVDPAVTGFRIGSITKTFTWTAVMQLAEQGKLDLDADVNRYLDFKVGDDGGPPVTLRQLMTHTAGFADVQKNIVFLDADAAMGTEQFLKHWAPPRLYTGGKVPAYSNYGAALAGHIVARVSGQPWEQYVERNILLPLGMTHTSARQPPAGAALGYASDGVTVRPVEFIAPAPAGAISASGLDMARYMIAHLRDGELGGARILGVETAQRMHAPAFTPVAGLDGMALGFMREDRRGEAIIGHAGGTMFFTSNMHLLLDRRVGVFIAFNGRGEDHAAGKLNGQLLERFLDRYFPRDVPAGQQLATAREHGRLVSGRYQSSQRALGFGRFPGLFGQTAVSVQDDGTLVIAAAVDEDGKPKQWREVAPFIWQEAGGSQRVAAILREGKVAGLYAEDGPASLWLPVSPARNAGWISPLLLVAQLVLFCAAVKWLGLALLRRKSVAGSGLVRAACVANLVFVSGLIAYLALALSGGAVALNDGIDPVLRAFQCAGLFGAIGTPLAFMDALRAWLARGTRWQRGASLALALSCAVTFCIALAFGLFSPDLHF